MEVLLDRYSTIKLYAAEPPLPYMIELIWTQIVLDNARTDPRFRKLRKKQKLPVALDVTEILKRLRAGFTFRSLDANAAEGSPETAHKSWVVKALEKLVNLREAEWTDATKVSSRILFQQYEDPLRHFVVACVQARKNHQSLNPINNGLRSIRLCFFHPSNLQPRSRVILSLWASRQIIDAARYTVESSQRSRQEDLR